MRTTIYVRSVAYVTDSRGQIGVCHPYALNGVENAFVTTRRTDDVLYEPDSTLLLEIAQRLPVKVRVAIEVVDLGTFFGRLKALLNGIHRTPCVVHAGVRYQGLRNAVRVLEGLVNNGQPDV